MSIDAILRDSRLLPPRFLQKGSKAYDLLAAAPLVAWYAISAAGTIQLLLSKLAQFFSHPDASLGLLILAKAAVLLLAFVAIVMLLMRPPATATAKGWGPRIAGLLGTYLFVGVVLFVPARPVPHWALAVSSALILGGIAFSVYAILYLGRSFSVIAEARTLVTGGPYARIRHPLYAGEQLALFGAMIQYISPVPLALLALQIVCQLYRMNCEEAVLEQTFPDYGAYKLRTARLIPGVY